mgnify:FL=1|tara:strand:+ start:49 stop:984 length:936 start_codon:yes stop_codon:yes gene_type:complete
MSGSDWSTRDKALVTLLGILYISVLAVAVYATGYSKATHRIEAQNYSAQYPADTKKRIEQCPADSKASLRECIEEIIASAHENHRSEQDLNAQRDMAKWAFWLLVFTVAQIPIGIVGLIVLLVTLRQGKEGLEKARDSNVIAKKVGEAQVKAYVRAEVLEVRFPSASLAIPHVLVKVSNLGNSPAYYVHCNLIFHYYWGETNFPDQGRSQEETEHDIGILVGDIPAQENITAHLAVGRQAHLTAEELEVLQRGRLGFDVRLEYTFRNVFDEDVSDWTKFTDGFARPDGPDFASQMVEVPVPAGNKLNGHKI